MQLKFIEGIPSVLGVSVISIVYLHIMDRLYIGFFVIVVTAKKFLEVARGFLEFSKKLAMPIALPLK